MKIGIVILATNSYFVLGVRFITKFMQYYKGKANITFYFFSNGDPKSYVPFSNVVWINTQHESWVEATNSKFKSIVSLVDKDEEYLYYFDADTSINKDFTEEWFIGDLVGGEHYCNRYEGRKPYDRNPISKAYVPLRYLTNRGLMMKVISINTFIIILLQQYLLRNLHFLSQIKVE